MINPLRFSAAGVALTYGVISLLVLAVFAAPLWYSWSTVIDGGRVERLDGDAARMSAVFRTQGLPALVTVIDASVGGTEHTISRVLLLADAAGRPIAGNLAAWPDIAPATGPQIRTLNVHGLAIRVAYVSRALPDGYRLLVGNNVERFEKLERLFQYGLLGCSITLLVIAVAGGLLMRQALLTRVGRIEQTTSAIVQGNLSSRLPTPVGNDELDALTRTVNRMLEQIEQLVLGAREVSNAIAHDLRTPLAALRYRLEEIVLTQPPLERTYAEIDSAILDVDEVLAIFNALLRLAEIDSGARRAGFTAIDVAEVAAEVVEFYLPLAELKGITLDYAGPTSLPAQGDRLMVAQAVGNLIDNALKYATGVGAISVSTAMHGAGVAITVADNGPGIPEVHLDKVVQRFYRVDPSRVMPGAGLGLSQVDAVARLHGGVLELASNQPGLRATLFLHTTPDEH